MWKSKIEASFCLEGKNSFLAITDELFFFVPSRFDRLQTFWSNSVVKSRCFRVCAILPQSQPTLKFTSISDSQSWSIMPTVVYFRQSKRICPHIVYTFLYFLINRSSLSFKRINCCSFYLSESNHYYLESDCLQLRRDARKGRIWETLGWKDYLKYEIFRL